MAAGSAPETIGLSGGTFLPADSAVGGRICTQKRLAGGVGLARVGGWGVYVVDAFDLGALDRELVAGAFAG